MHEVRMLIWISSRKMLDCAGAKVVEMSYRVCVQRRWFYITVDCLSDSLSSDFEKGSGE